MSIIKLNDGKYTVINELNEGGGLRALRYGEEWRNLAGDNLVLAMAQEIEELREQNEGLIRFLHAEGYVDDSDDIDWDDVE